HDLVGERLGSEEQHFPLRGKVGDGEADVGGERAHQHRRLLARDQFLSDAHRVAGRAADRKSTRLNSSHLGISYAVFCLKKKMFLALAWAGCRDIREFAVQHGRLGISPQFTQYKGSLKLLTKLIRSLARYDFVHNMLALF